MESLVQWFTYHLGSVLSGEVVIFIISMIPILELRGGLLAASPALLDVPILTAIPLCILGNILPIPFILLLINHILEWMKTVSVFRPVALWLERKAMSKKDSIEKYEFWGAGALCGYSASGNRRLDRRADRVASAHPLSKGLRGHFPGHHHRHGHHVRLILRRAGRFVRVNACKAALSVID